VEVDAFGDFRWPGVVGVTFVVASIHDVWYTVLNWIYSGLEYTA
jgi:hypothetical protein